MNKYLKMIKIYFKFVYFVFIKEKIIKLDWYNDDFGNFLR